ncbi:MAG: sensor histidine kinase KdpD [Actinobacteria bacterium]|nr:sensor histidine kinase KdpD [Actinomycetota bacterium]
MPDDQPHTETFAGMPRPRGMHKVFLGYAPGVGKTYTMLAEAGRRASRGEDIVVGFVEPHDRAETLALLEGLEKVPTKSFEYRGKTLHEMDTDAVLARRPEWALVDELAHTNAPGARHEKRWQSVDELLDAGINVISTVNVQHLESLNDTVFDITGVRVRETLPDSVLDAADEVVLVDLTPQALVNRLRRGVVYSSEMVPRALEHFFRPGNLGALRELALRKTAQEVDDELLEYIEDKRIEGVWPTSDRILVCVTPRQLSTTLVRRGYRLAQRLKGEFECLSVRVPGIALSAADKASLQETRGLAERLGAIWVEAESENPAQEIVRYAKEHHVSFIVLGQSGRSRVAEILGGSVVNHIMRETVGVDVLVVADAERR